jgi:hypothetical protein
LDGVVAQEPRGLVDQRSVGFEGFPAPVDLAEALDAIPAVELRDVAEVADRSLHDPPAPDVPGPAADPGRPDIGG